MGVLTGAIKRLCEISQVRMLTQVTKKRNLSSRLKLMGLMKLNRSLN
jgi:hypothetical protein